MREWRLAPDEEPKPAKEGVSGEIRAWTDGASVGAIGPGGWGVVAIVDDELFEFSGGARRTTNQRMEMIAALVALRRCPDESDVAIHSDSAYLVNGMRQKWYAKWQSNGWRNSAKKPVKNRDLWLLLIDEEARHRRVEWVKVKGHVENVSTESHRYNARADHLAVEAKQRELRGGE